LLRRRHARQGVRHSIVCPFLVDDLVVEPKELREHLLLTGGVEALFIEVYETLLIGTNNEFTGLQVMSPLVNCN
jgi:hypothetical protein